MARLAAAALSIPRRYGPIGGRAPLLQVLIGLLSGVLSGLLTRFVLCLARTCSWKLPIHWMWWPAIGGLVVGVGGLY